MGRILIVDDEEMDRVMEFSVLEDAGHEILFAADGQTALALWKEKSIDLVITDLVMPELNGLRLIKAIKELDPSARIIAISGLAPEQLDLAEDYGALRTLTKPFPREAMLKAVAEVLAQAPRRGGDPWGRTR